MLATTALNPEFLAAGLAEAAAAREVQVRNFTPEPWFQDSWCWAAMATMVHRCLTLEDLPQCFWAQKLISMTCCQQPRNCRVGQAVDVVLRIKGHCRKVEAGPLSFANIQNEIPEQGPGRPVVCGQPGHVVVLCTWGIDPSDGEYVRYADPAQQGLQWALYSVFRDIKGGGWVATFLTQ